MIRTAYKKVTLILWVLFMSAIGVIGQETFVSPSGLNVTVPAGWTYEIEGDLLTINSPDELVVISFIDIEGDSVEEAIQGALEAIGEEFEDLGTTVEPVETKINGLEAVTWEATGTSDGVELDLGMMLVKNGENWVFVYAVGATGQYEKHRKSIKSIWSSIKQ